MSLSRAIFCRYRHKGFPSTSWPCLHPLNLFTIMFNINVTNNFVSDLTINGSTTVAAGGGTGSTGSVGGTQTIDVPNMGTILVLDLGHDQVPGFSLPESWGVLMRYRSVELYYRYEGGGNIDLVVDQFGSVDVVSVQGSALIISLSDMTYQGQ